MTRKARSLYDEVGDRKTVYVEDAKPKAKSRFLGGKFMMIGMETYRVLYKLDVPLSVHKVMYWLCAHNEYCNTVSGWTQQQIADDCGVHRTHIAKSLATLESHQLIIMLERGHCLLNPYLWYRGKLEAQQEACERWDGRLAVRGQVFTPLAVAQ